MQCVLVLETSAALTCQLQYSEIAKVDYIR